MRVILAPDKFKGSLSAPEAARHLAAGLRSANPALDLELVPLGDGGEGTVDAATAAGFTRITTTVEGPTGRPVEADFAVRGATAVIEMAAASGLHVLDGGTPAPLTASSFGTGQLVRAALDAGCTEIVLGVGGSACTDGGAGMLAALGAKLLDGKDRPVPRGGGALAAVSRIVLETLDPRLAGTRFTLASDVDNPLLGPDGTAAVFGPQKGATRHQVEQLESALERYFRVLSNELGMHSVDASNQPGSGAAGGVGFAALAVLNAERRPGINVVMELTALEQRLPGAAIVVTGEGSLDHQSLRGKAPVGVAAAAELAGVRTLAVCGRTTLDDSTLRGAGFDRTFALTDLEPDTARCMSHAGELLERIGATIGMELAAARKEETSLV
ncbi:glycerate kinase [Arthrobacter sp. SDTb3-6]|uniref:glycerate kinase n=1 Tax=Arthrobacter sp. SDTb3-6 TaxID=2713571 RepID=UPI00159E5872|nr:glycerate kinase [Arthrobacter sp. SDTb3-6]NVN00436.1 glycerate kinase [Arthrobacter sp. SDTb3-6]